MNTNFKPSAVLTANQDTETDVLEEVVTKKEDISDLIIHNDDFNTFEFVQQCLMDICGHTSEQAHQCSLIIHNNGKCSVKRGTFKKLRPLCEALIDRDLSATIE